MRTFSIAIDAIGNKRSRVKYLVTGLSAIVQVIVAAGLDGKDEQLAVKSSPIRYVVLGELIHGESLGGTKSKKFLSNISPRHTYKDGICDETIVAMMDALLNRQTANGKCESKTVVV